MRKLSPVSQTGQLDAPGLAASQAPRVLLIKLKHIGDSLLLTPTAVALRARHPRAVIWVVVRKGCEGILAGCPAIDRVLTSAAPEAENRSSFNWLGDAALLRELRAQRFDFTFELSDNNRGRWLAWLSSARTICADGGFRQLNWWWRRWFDRVSHSDWQNVHQVEKDYQTVSRILPLGGQVPPLCFERERTRPWDEPRLQPRFVVFHPGTRWLRKRWPVARWIETGRYLSRQGWQIVISAGPDAEEVTTARQIEQAVGAPALTTAGQLSWPQLAGLLYRARLFVGVDTAAMHLAAACQTPTVALFGPSPESYWRPWKVRHRLVRPHDFLSTEELAKISATELMNHLPVGLVTAACAELLQEPNSFRM